MVTMTAAVTDAKDLDAAMASVAEQLMTATDAVARLSASFRELSAKVGALEPRA